MHIFIKMTARETLIYSVWAALFAFSRVKAFVFCAVMLPLMLFSLPCRFALAQNVPLTGDDVAALSCTRGEEALRAVLARGVNLDQPLPGDGRKATALMACLENRQERLSLLLLDAGASATVKSEPGWTALDIAAGYATPETVSRLIQAGANINGSRDYIPLFTAAQYNSDVGVARLLVQNGANLQRQNSGKESVLMRAARNPNPEVFSFLLQSGANWRAAANDQRTALFFAAENTYSTASLEQLLALGLSPNDRTERQETPLFYAVKAANLPGVRLLLASGANPGAVNSEKQTLLHASFPYGMPNMKPMLALLLQSGASPGAADEFGVTPLLYAAEAARTIDMAEMLLDAGADIRAADNRGITPLLMACLNDNPAMLSFFMSKGADPLAKDGNRSTALMYALVPLSSATDQKPWLAAVQSLLDAGVSVSAQNAWGRTALSLAASGNSEEVIRFLLQKGAGPNSRDMWNMSPLFWAAYAGSVPKVELLLPLTDIAQTDNEGQDVMFWAASSPVRGGVIPFLLQKGISFKRIDAHGRSPLMYLASAGAPENIPLLLKAGCKIDAADDQGRTALMWAASNHPGMVKALLAAGASADAADAGQWTALHYFSAIRRDPEGILPLISAARDIDAQDSQGRTPLMVAAAYAPESVMAALLEGGAQINAADKNGWTPLYYLLSGNPDKDAMGLFIVRRANGSVRDGKGGTALHAFGQYLNQDPPVACPRFSGAGDARRYTARCGVSPATKVNIDVLEGAMQIVRSVDARDNYGRTAFMLFSQNSASRKPLEKFVWAGARINNIDNNGVTPLMYAARGNPSVEVLDYLLEVHASLDTLDMDGRNALIHAAASGANSAVIEHLLAAGADRRQKDKSGKCALDYLEQNKGKYAHDVYGYVSRLLAE